MDDVGRWPGAVIISGRWFLDYVLRIFRALLVTWVLSCLQCVRTPSLSTFPSHILVRGALTAPGDDPVTDGEKELLSDVLTHLIRLGTCAPHRVLWSVHACGLHSISVHMWTEFTFVLCTC